MIEWNKGRKLPPCPKEKEDGKGESQNIPSSFTHKSRNGEEEKHEKHGRMLKVIQVCGVESAIYHKAPMGGIQKLHTHVDEAADNDDVQFHIPKT